MAPTYFIEDLNLMSWLLSVWPRLVASRLGSKTKVVRCHVIDGSALAILFAKISALPLGVDVQRINFAMSKIKDEKGIQILLRIVYQDLAEVQERVVEGQPFKDIVQKGGLPDRLPDYLAKNVTAIFGGLSAWSNYVSGRPAKKNQPDNLSYL